jgi:LysR family cyn operon transcriptional activator
LKKILPAVSAAQSGNPGRIVGEPFEMRHLRYFLEVAEAGSFSRAAERLGLSQPSISLQMRYLEAALQVYLFQRRGRRMLLTSTGQVFQEHARSILCHVENLLQELNTEPAQLRGALHVGVIPMLNMALIPPLLGMFAKEHPAVSLTVDEIPLGRIETAIEEGQIDVGLGFLTRHSPRLRYERLYNDQFALILAPSHPWAKRHLVDLKELHQQRLLQLLDTFAMRRITDAICRQNQVRPRIVAEMNAIETLLRSLGPLKAAALMPEIAVRDVAGLKIVPLKGTNLTVEIGLLRLIDSDGSAAVREFSKLALATVPLIIRKQRAQRVG